MGEKCTYGQDACAKKGCCERESSESRWMITLDNIESLMRAMREDSEGMSSEERVALDTCSRRLTTLWKMIRGRAHARELGAIKCAECGGDAMLLCEHGMDTWRPYIECQVCGSGIKTTDLGILEAILPANKYLIVEEALVKAWNARGGVADAEDRSSGERWRHQQTQCDHNRRGSQDRCRDRHA